MKWLAPGALALALAACGSHVAANDQPVAPATPGACGDQTCAPTELCIEELIGAGDPGSESTSRNRSPYHYECRAEPYTKNGSWDCAPPADGKQKCHALVPSAPR